MASLNLFQLWLESVNVRRELIDLTGVFQLQLVPVSRQVLNVARQPADGVVSFF